MPGTLSSRFILSSENKQTNVLRDDSSYLMPTSALLLLPMTSSDRLPNICRRDPTPFGYDDQSGRAVFGQSRQ